MIRAVMVMNTQGKPRLLKFYEFKVIVDFLPFDQCSGLEFPYVAI
jgi:hypothetical protein